MLDALTDRSIRVKDMLDEFGREACAKERKEVGENSNGPNSKARPYHKPYVRSHGLTRHHDIVDKFIATRCGVCSGYNDAVELGHSLAVVALTGQRHQRGTR
jgi:hypothetical protein